MMLDVQPPCRFGKALLIRARGSTWYIVESELENMELSFADQEKH